MATITVNTGGKGTYAVCWDKNIYPGSYNSTYRVFFLFIKANSGYVLNYDVPYVLNTETIKDQQWDIVVSKVSSFSEEYWNGVGISPPSGYEFFLAASVYDGYLSFNFTPKFVSAYFSCDPTNGGYFKEILFNDTSRLLYRIVANEGFEYVNTTCSVPGIEPPKYSTGATYTAHFRAYNQWIVTFDAGHGSVAPKTKIVTVGHPYGDLPTPTWQGHTFVGWYYGKYLVTKDTVVEKNCNHTLTAEWDTRPEPDPTKVIVTFDTQVTGVTVSPTYKEVTVGDEYGDIPTPTYEGHVFKGWYDSPNGGNRIYSSTRVTIESDHTIYALWNVEPARSYSVTVGAKIVKYTEPYVSGRYDQSETTITVSYTDTSGTQVARVANRDSLPITVNVKPYTYVYMTCDKPVCGTEMFSSWGCDSQSSSSSQGGVATSPGTGTYFEELSQSTSYSFYVAENKSIYAMFKVNSVVYCRCANVEYGGSVNIEIIDGDISSRTSTYISMLDSGPVITDDYDRNVNYKYLYYYGDNIRLSASEFVWIDEYEASIHPEYADNYKRKFLYWETPNGERYESNEVLLPYKQEYSCTDEGEKYFVARYDEVTTVDFDDCTSYSMCNNYVSRLSYSATKGTFNVLPDISCKIGVNNGRIRNFLGWYTDPLGGEKISVGDEINGIKRAYAHWESVIFMECRPKDGYLNNKIVSCSISAKDSASTRERGVIVPLSRLSQYKTSTDTNDVAFTVVFSGINVVDAEIKIYCPGRASVPSTTTLNNVTSMSTMFLEDSFLYYTRDSGINKQYRTTHVTGDVYITILFGVHTNIPIRRQGKIIKSVSKQIVIRDS